jgi:KDO2-lipid IV(A) lauroyltransferase
VAALAPAAEKTTRLRAASPSERAGAAALSALSWLVCRLPEAPLRGAAELVGVAWYLGAPRRRAQARRNLRRVAEALVVQRRAGPRVRAAAGSRVGLEWLVVTAFRHLGRYYLEVARGPATARQGVSGRIDDIAPGPLAEIAAAGLGRGGSGKGLILVGLHLGALEFPSHLIAEAGIRITAPMEVLDNPALQAYFLRTRGHGALRLLPQEGARAELTATLERGEAVGLVSDRVVRGRGAPALLFGHPVRLPVGPALLAVDSGAPAYAAAVWRVGGGRYAGRMVRLETPREGDRNERVRTFLESQAAVFESFIAEAPEQWWSVFFPVWPDLEAATARGRGSPAP